MSEKVNRETEVGIGLRGDEFIVAFNPPLPREHNSLSKTDTYLPTQIVWVDSKRKAIREFRYAVPSIGWGPEVQKRIPVFIKNTQTAIVNRLEGALFDPTIVELGRDDILFPEEQTVLLHHR